LLIFLFIKRLLKNTSMNKTNEQKKEQVV